MSKQRNQYLTLKTIQKMYTGTSIENLVKNAIFLSDIKNTDIEDAKINYSLTDKLVKFYLKETLKEEKTSKFYQLMNSWRIQCDLCTSYLAGNLIKNLEEIEITPKKEKNIQKVWEEDDLQLDTCKGPGYLHPKEFNYK